jgi:hypothetical protein
VSRSDHGRGGKAYRPSMPETPILRSMNEFERWYFPQQYRYQCQVRYAAEHGLAHWLARSVLKAAKGARVPEPPEGFYRDVELASLSTPRVLAALQVLAGASR